MSNEDEVFEDELDPRVKGELDILNQSTDEINSLETELNECRAKFKASLENATQKLQILMKKYGKAIERARPYYQAKAEVAQANLALQRAVNNFRRANGIYQAAKETITLAELRLSEFEDKKVDATWQEVLNQQTIRFNEAERDRRRSKEIHERATKKFEFLENKMQTFLKKHKNSTTKTKPYFELKELLEIDLQKRRQRVDELQRKVDAAKKRYKQSLGNLEQISSEIHEKRRESQKMIEALGVRKLGERREDDTVDGRLPSNPMDLDLFGPTTYDDIDELEADLDNFDLEDSDEEGLSSSESEAESDGSTPSMGAKKPHLKRSNTAPERRLIKEKVNRQTPSRVTLKRKPHVIKRAVSVSKDSRPSGTNRSNDSEDEEEHDIFQPSSRNITPIAEDAENGNLNNKEDEEKDESTYRRLHGTNIDQQNRKKPPLPPKPKKQLQAPEEYDIFDELC